MIVACFFVSDRLSAINYDKNNNKTDITSSSDTFMSFQISLASRSLTVEFLKKRRAEVGWLVGCFGFYGPLRQYFGLYRAVSQREGEKGEKG